MTWRRFKAYFTDAEWPTFTGALRMTPPKDLDLDHALYVLSRYTIVQSREPGWSAEAEDRRNRALLNNVLAALGLRNRIEIRKLIATEVVEPEGLSDHLVGQYPA